MWDAARKLGAVSVGVAAARLPALRTECKEDRSPFRAGSPPSEELKAEVRAALITQKANACPMASRLAWHASGTYSSRDGSGGSTGATMRFKPEIDDDANKGLGIIRDLLLPIKKRHPELSNADLWCVASCAAIEFLGGPVIPLVLGRSDTEDASKCPENGRLPDAHLGAEHLREVFGRMGFNDQEIVALSGAHTMGRCHKVRSGFDGPWTSKPLSFDNEYFRNLMNLEWKRRDWDGEPQYEDPSGELMMLPTDLALKTDPGFARWAKVYAESEDAFFRDFAQAYSKLIHLGCKHKPEGGIQAPTDTSIAAPGSGVITDHDSEQFREHAMHGSLERMQRHAVRADVHSVDQPSGRSALHKAAFWGHLHVVKYLINTCKLDPNHQDSAGDTALHDAVRFGHAGIVKALASVTNTNLKNKDGYTPADLARQMDKEDLLEHLTRQHSPINLTTSYGKQSVPVFKIRKMANGSHEVLDFMVEIMLEGDIDASWLTGENNQILPTETQKNTCYALALKTEYDHPVTYGLALARSILTRHTHLEVVNLDIIDRPWNRAKVQGRMHNHVFTKPKDTEKWTARLRVPQTGPVEITCGIRDHCVMKTTQSGFEGFIRDEFTNLEPTGPSSENPDRIMCTELQAYWKYDLPNDAQIQAHNFKATDAAIMELILEEWAGPPDTGIMSKSVQETAYRAGSAVLATQPSIKSIELIAPNIHHYRWDGEKFGLRNPNVVFQSTDCYTTASGRIKTLLSK